jgi:hypothetical protein
MAVLDDVPDREIRRDIGVHQRREGRGDQDELRDRGALADRHQAGMPPRGAP